MPNRPKCTEKKILLLIFPLADSCRLLRPSGTSSMRGGYLAPLIEELAAVRLTEEFIVFGKANYVGVDA